MSFLTKVAEVLEALADEQESLETQPTIKAAAQNEAPVKAAAHDFGEVSDRPTSGGALRVKGTREEQRKAAQANFATQFNSLK